MVHLRTGPTGRRLDVVWKRKFGAMAVQLRAQAGWPSLLVSMEKTLSRGVAGSLEA